MNDSSLGRRPDRLAIALNHIESARAYTMTLIDDLEPDDWYWQPREGITHVAWQVGHIAMAQYGLTLFRQRGRKTEDAELMSGAFRKQFMKGTNPNPSRAENPSPADILAVLERVHTQMRRELPTFGDEELNEAVDPPHAAFDNRFGALLFAADHEMLHAGQIGLLRRLMGKAPLR